MDEKKLRIGNGTAFAEVARRCTDSGGGDRIGFTAPGGRPWLAKMATLPVPSSHGDAVVCQLATLVVGAAASWSAGKQRSFIVS
jgi:hypothetical protein